MSQRTHKSASTSTDTTRSTTLQRFASVRSLFSTDRRPSSSDTTTHESVSPGETTSRKEKHLKILNRRHNFSTPCLSSLPTSPRMAPMPTFQKPVMKENHLDRQPTTSTANLTKNSPTELPTKTSHEHLLEPSYLLHTRPNHPRSSEPTTQLPPTWTTQHDRAICILDARNYSSKAIVSKLRRVFPREFVFLSGDSLGLINTLPSQPALTSAMIERRLRQLDQDVRVDYWRIGLESLDGGGDFQAWGQDDVGCTEGEDGVSTGRLEDGRYCCGDEDENEDEEEEGQENSISQLSQHPETSTTADVDVYMKKTHS